MHAVVAVARGVRDPVIEVLDERRAALDRLDGVVIVGGDDIDTRTFGVPLHPMARVMDPERQSAELAMLAALDARPAMPVLGFCLRIQRMGVHRGATHIQHLEDRISHAARHRDDRVHAVQTAVGSGPVASWHHQALADAPGFAEIGRSDDGVLEAIRDDGRPFYLGVQWHPERTADATLGDGVFRLLVQ
ncbi:MAG: gamma-glutamyl-gamma-aminobutyrate hydrolase family protein, partial [Phycisphaerales bacterium]